MAAVAAVDIGGHNIRCWIARSGGEVLASGVARIIRDAPTSTVNIEVLVELIRKLMADAGVEAEELTAISLGVPGAADSETGIVLLAPNIPHWTGKNIRDEIREYFDVKVLIENDVNLAALGEVWKGVAAGCKDFFFMALGTGIGGGLFLNGRLVRGKHFTAGEVGYLALAPFQPEKRMGDLGWFESMASGLAIDMAGADAALRNPTSRLGELASKGPLTSREVFAAAAEGDAEANEILSQAFEYMTLAVVNITALVDPEMIVFGGGVGSQGERVLGPVRERAARYGLPVPPLRVSSLGEQAQLYGALYAAVMDAR